MRTRWPWISMLVWLPTSARSAATSSTLTFAGEALSRKHLAPIALTIVAVMAAAIRSEWLIRTASAIAARCATSA